jgi:hypothetical protein
MVLEVFLLIQDKLIRQCITVSLPRRWGGHAGEISVVGCASNNLPLCAACQAHLQRGTWPHAKDTFLEAPGQDKELVRLHVTRLSCGHFIPGYATELQYNIAPS